MKLAKNMGTTDRIIRFVLAAIFAVLYFTGTVSGTFGIILLGAGSGLCADRYSDRSAHSTCHLVCLRVQNKQSSNVPASAGSRSCRSFYLISKPFWNFSIHPPHIFR